MRGNEKASLLCAATHRTSQQWAQPTPKATMLLGSTDNKVSWASKLALLRTITAAKIDATVNNNRVATRFSGQLLVINKNDITAKSYFGSRHRRNVGRGSHVGGGSGHFQSRVFFVVSGSFLTVVFGITTSPTFDFASSFANIVDDDMMKALFPSPGMRQIFETRIRRPSTQQQNLHQGLLNDNDTDNTVSQKNSIKQHTYSIWYVPIVVPTLPIEWTDW